jgi:apolipoprotein N-acyltransferase
MGLTEAAADAGYGIVLWPEAALDVPFLKAENRLQQLVEARQLELIGGFNVAEGSVLRNAVLVIDRCGNVRGRYHKNLLIPLSESEYERGDNALPLRTSFGSVATPVCWEAQFEYYVRRLVRQGARAILVFSDESGLRSAMASRLVLGQTILRAVENRRYLVRVNQSGHSAVIDPFGRMVCGMDSGEEGFLGARIRLSDQESLAARLGEWWVVLPVLVSAGLIARSRANQSETERI